jgi:hypothetical protein
MTISIFNQKLAKKTQGGVCHDLAFPDCAAVPVRRPAPCFMSLPNPSKQAVRIISGKIWL